MTLQEFIAKAKEKQAETKQTETKQMNAERFKELLEKMKQNAKK